jgi:hypothetical protein
MDSHHTVARTMAPRNLTRSTVSASQPSSAALVTCAVLRTTIDTMQITGYWVMTSPNLS